MNLEPNTPHIPIDRLIAAASDEDWELVDKALSDEGDVDRYLGWASSVGLLSNDPNLRDLAASIYGKSDAELSEHVENALRGMMAADENIYARYRAAFALFGRGDRSKEVVETITQATSDEDVSDVANAYLAKLDD